MTNTICGHGRDVLIWVLSVHVRERCLMAPCELSETEAQSASDAVHDPAKLAEMLAAVDHNHEFVISGDTIERCKWGRGKRLVTLNIWTMAEARGELLRILTTDHVDPDELLNTIPLHERVEPRRFDPDPDRGRE